MKETAIQDRAAREQLDQKRLSHFLAPSKQLSFCNSKSLIESL